jgi:sarcosine oxidase, subunit alpha
MRRDDIVVVGGGISGTFAALTARQGGASVTLIDEQSAVGGYLRWTVDAQEGVDPRIHAERGFEIARACWELLYDADVNVQLNSTAWGLFEENVLGIVNPESSYQLKADKLILATGSTDIGIPFQGWELAGVMTARAALIAMHVYRVLPGKRIGLVGNGADAARVRAALEMSGAEVVMQINNPAEARVGGDGVVEWIAADDTQVPVNAVVTVHGAQPDPGLLLQALADTGYSSLSGVHVPLRDDSLQSTVSDVYVIGDAAGISTTAEAIAEGIVAGEAAINGKDLDKARERLSELRSTERAAEIQRLRPTVPTR